MKRHPAVPVVVLASLIAFTLSGCVPAAPADTSMAPSAPPAATSEAPMPTAEPTTPPAPPAPPALATDCSALVDAASIAAIQGSGFDIPNAADITAYVDKTRGEGSPLALFVDGGGLLCPVTNGTRVSELFGFSPITAADAATQKARLLAEGLTLSAHLGGELYSDTSGQDGVVFEYLFAGDYWFCAIDVLRLDEVVANSGAAI